MGQELSLKELSGFISKFKSAGALDEIAVDPHVMSNFFQSFDDLWSAEVKKGAECNIWDVADLRRDELRNSKVLAWLLDPQQTHGQGSLFLDAFCALLDSEMKNVEASKDARVITESLPLGEQESRVDIEIDSEQLLLFIEVKIDAPEQKYQLDRYLQIADRKAGDRRRIVCFLTLTGKPPESTERLKDVLSISWKECANAFKRVDIDNGSFIGLVVRQFCEHISRL